MKLLTLNFLSCAIKTCKSNSQSFPLHPKECELVADTIPMNTDLLLNLLPRIEWEALRGVCVELDLPPLPTTAPTKDELAHDEALMRNLHTLLLETQIQEGGLQCAVCGHVYGVKEGIGNFLLPGHLV